MNYQQLVQYFQTICDKHLAINGFGEGSIKDLDTTSQNIEYPYCYLRPLQSDGLTLNDNGYGGVRKFTFELYILDIPKLDDEDQLNLMSNCEQYLNDIVAYFNFGPLQQELFAIVEDVTPLYEAFADRTVGWACTVNIEMPYRLDFCNFPD